MAILFGAAQCDTPLVDRQEEFFVTNRNSSTIEIYLGLQYEGFTEINSSGRDLPTDGSILRSLSYAPILPTETGYIVVGTRERNLFDELPDRVLRIWIFDKEMLDEMPYDSIRLNPDFFDLITLTEDEYATLGDTLFID
jgi:hypothetical protein